MFLICYFTVPGEKKRETRGRAGIAVLNLPGLSTSEEMDYLRHAILWDVNSDHQECFQKKPFWCFTIYSALAPRYAKTNMAHFIMLLCSTAYVSPEPVHFQISNHRFTNPPPLPVSLWSQTAEDSGGGQADIVLVFGRWGYGFWSFHSRSASPIGSTLLATAHSLKNSAYCYSNNRDRKEKTRLRSQCQPAKH